MDYSFLPLEINENPSPIKENHRRIVSLPNRLSHSLLSSILHDIILQYLLLRMTVFGFDSMILHIFYDNLNALRAYPATVPTTQYPDCSMCPDVFAL